MPKQIQYARISCPKSTVLQRPLWAEPTVSHAGTSPREDASVDLFSHLVALYILSQVLLTFSRSLDRLE